MISRSVLVILALNVVGVIAASAQTDPRAWWVVLGVAAVSEVCIAVLINARR